MGKPLFVDVVGASRADPEVPAPEVQLKAWVGILSMSAEPLIEFPCPPDATYLFGEEVIPSAAALVKLADDQFAFTTAESGGGTEGMFKRMSAVESSLNELRGMLQDALKLPKDQTPDGEQLPEATRLGARAKSMAAPKGGAPFAGLDRGTIAAARNAGVSESALHEMAKLMRRLDLSASTKDSAWGPWTWMPAISRRTRSPPHCRRAGPWRMRFCSLQRS